MTTTKIECGTYAGYQRHVRRGEVTCADCRRASAAYMRQFRESRPDIRADERRRNAARDRAAWRLVDEYRSRFHELYVEELG